MSAAHAVGDLVGGSDANLCPRHHGQPGGTVTAIDGTEWTRVAFADGSYCEGPASAFTAAGPLAAQPPAGWPTFYLTFGARYATKTHPTCPAARPDGWIAVVAPDYTAARAFVIERFGTRWCELYAADEFRSSYFPLGELGRIVADPPALTLPDGWTAQGDSDPYYRKVVPHVAIVDVFPRGVYVSTLADRIETTAQVSHLGAVLLQAAEILMQLLAGAR